MNAFDAIFRVNGKVDKNRYLPPPDIQINGRIKQGDDSDPIFTDQKSIKDMKKAISEWEDWDKFVTNEAKTR